MRLASLRNHQNEYVCLHLPFGLLPLERLNHRLGHNWPTDLLSLLQSGQFDALQAWYGEAGEQLAALQDLALPHDEAVLAPLYRRPRKIWGIGLNYQAHAADLSEESPTQTPASFMKPDTTIIGPGDTIEIPPQSKRTTAEGELGVVIGRRCKDVARDDWLSVVAGFTPLIDMTAEDILRQNPRYLTLSKSFDTFFSFGPVLVTPDEIDDLAQLDVATVINDAVHARNEVENMTFPPDFLVSFHSQVMTLLPGDVISTGTPGATPIQDGDTVACRIDGFETLENPVRQR